MPYNFKQLKDIYTERAKHVFASDSISPSAISATAQFVAENGGDVRLGLDCLLRAGQSSCEKVNLENIRPFLVSAKNMQLKERLKGLPKSHIKLLRVISLMTKSGFLGTLDYVAPEQIKASSNVDHRADLYSLGVMTYQMLSGRLPFENTNPGAVIFGHLTLPPPDLQNTNSAIPASIASAVQRMMSKEPEQRFQSAAEFLNIITPN